jgi:hypothetical protein
MQPLTKKTRAMNAAFTAIFFLAGEFVFIVFEYNDTTLWLSIRKWQFRHHEDKKNWVFSFERPI